MTIIVGAVVIDRLCRSALKSVEDPAPGEQPLDDTEVEVKVTKESGEVNITKENGDTSCTRI